MSAEALPPTETEDGRAAADWRGAFTKDELAELREFHAWRSWLTIGINWALVAGFFTLVAVWPNPLTFLVALVGLGGRQLGCAVIMHEAGHRTLFKNRRLNDWAGNWLGAYPAWSGEVAPYRRYHGLHHANTGTERDPDLGLSAKFPTTRKSLYRKIWRDLSGQTGYKQAKLLLKRDLGFGGKRNQRNRGLRSGETPDVGWHKLVPVIATNGVIFGACWISGHPELYLLWPLAWLTTYRFVLRVRSIAEHALTGPAEDPFRNTRTTTANWLTRTFVVPARVNYHLEHHLIMTVPHYKLPRFHRMLKERGLLDDALISHSYLGILRDVSQEPA